jgi:hypothetical protein
MRGRAVTVWVPYTSVSPETRDALRLDSPAYVWVGGDEGQYWRLVRGLWESGRAFAIVEHDVVPPPGAVAEMWACPQDWCAFPYPVGDIVTTALGCTKFEAAIIERHPMLVGAIPENGRDWHSLDASVIGELHRRGEHEHVHGPAARHAQADRPKEERMAIIRLRYTGDGSRYLHEDAAHGIPPIPPADFETDDPRVASIAVESGLYTEAAGPETIRKGRARVKDEAPAADADAADTAEKE